MQPEWSKPTGTAVPVLKVNNSMKTGSLDEFIPAEGKLVRWYTCGPTVYDSSHLGHARSYLSFDILRRIVEDYFGYHVFACMNITDLDDKIIIKSRQNYLFEEYAKEYTVVTEKLLSELNQAWDDYIASLQKKIQKTHEDEKAGKKNKSEIIAERKLLESKEKDAHESKAELKLAKIGESSGPWLEKCKTPLSSVLDAQKAATMDSELVKSLCDKHTKKYEAEYFEDMKALGIKDPDVLVRVTEYVPYIVEYVQKIIDRGFAYPAQGSVYFDTVKFHNAENHAYGKLRPDAVGNMELFSEGEGGLSSATSQDRKTEKDFALWKASKPGEPSWDSPWGKGRPGWHIECSAMASQVLGQTLDVHCGGCDLKFPHHDNELAQSEAFFDCKQWVNYFLHTGHLSIDGLKMSKSLKNFISIREALNAGNNATQIRFLFLIQEWDREINYQRQNTMGEVDVKIKTFTEFLRKAKQTSIERTTANNESWNQKDLDLHNALLETQKKVHESLCNNFDTKSSIQALIDVVTLANKYMSNNPSKKGLLLVKIADYINKILSVFGVPSLLDEGSAAGGQSKEEILRPAAKTLVDFRKEIRSTAKLLNSLCDRLRDEEAPNVGIKIVDDDPSFDFYLVDPETLAKEKRKREAEVEIKKLSAELNKDKRALQRAEEGSQSPQALILASFKVKMEEFGKFPEKDEKGSAIGQKTQQNINKKWEAQAKLHAEYLQNVAQNPNFLEELKQSVAFAEKRLEELKALVD